LGEGPGGDDADEPYGVDLVDEVLNLLRLHLGATINHSS
jgi:hypothetical protein